MTTRGAGTAVKADARQPPVPANPGLVQARPRERMPDEDVSAMLPLVEALAVLTADLWFAGKLDQLPLEEESDAED